MLDSYGRAILIHKEASHEHTLREKIFKAYFAKLVELEGSIFKEGYYKAMALISGSCALCAERAKLKDNPCIFGNKARPSMEACGIDVYQTVRNNGFFIKTLREKTETRNAYCLMLVD